MKIPVIAAGGIADGRGIAAAFMLGAEGVQMGTHFVVTDESQVHDNYKERIINRDKVKYRNSFGNQLFIFMTVVMKSNKVAIVRINTRS